MALPSLLQFITALRTRVQSVTSFNLRRWLKQMFAPEVSTYVKPRFRLTLEPLETRLAPATFIWDGIGDDNKPSLGKARRIAIGVKDQFGALRLQSLDNTIQKRVIVQNPEKFVPTAHAPR